MDKVLRELDEQKISRFAYNYFKDLTPIDTGNAKRKTRLSGNEITTNYPYAQRLDTGYSKQAPEGMSKPTLKAIKRYVYEKLGITL